MKYKVIFFSMIIAILFVGITNTAYGVNTLNLPDILVEQSTTGTFDLDLTNEDTVASAQIRFTYDSTIGFTVTGVGVTSRTNGYDTAFDVDTSDPTNVEVTVLLYSYGLTISPGSGDILQFDYQTTVDGEGTSPLAFTEALLSDQSASPLPATPQNGEVSFQACEAGDINCDGAINIFDLQLLINCIIGTGSCEGGDLNDDGLYNIFDLQLLINKILAS